MSLFNESIIDDSPITAQFLRSIIEKRRVNSNTPDEERYIRILDRIYKVVEYNINKDIYNYKISFDALGIVGPFCNVFIKEINEKISTGIILDDLYEYIVKRQEEISREEFWDSKFLKFSNYFKSRGFRVSCDWRQYIKLSDNDDRVKAKIIIISWDEKI